MYCIEMPNRINDLMSLFYYVGFWHRGDTATVRQTRLKLFYSFYYLLFPISSMAGAIKSDNDDAIFLVEITVATIVVHLKLLYIIWRKDQILELLHRIGVYSMESREEFTLANDKLKKYLKFTMVLIVNAIASGYGATLLPIFLKERKLFFNIGFPFDWKNNEIAFWLANFFIFTQVSLTLAAVIFSLLIWYLMLNCALRYEILQIQIRNMGVLSATTEPCIERSDLEKQNSFHRNLIAAIDSHQYIRNLIHQMESFVDNIFLTKIITGGLCICGSTYCLAFNVGETLLGQLIHLGTLVYNVTDIYMIMYLGNEIKFSSDRLSYCLFESNWVDQCKKTKKLIIIFGELLKQPHEIVIGKLYPLTLETFRRILNFAYNTFNILKNSK